MANDLFSSESELPPSLDAEILYPCKSVNKAGNVQAKCIYFHEGKQYRGIVFGPDNEDWLKDVPSGTLIKTQRVRSCTNPDYPGEFMGDALPLQHQSLNPKMIDVSYDDLPNILRTAANMIESFNQKQPVKHDCPAPIKEDLRYRNSAQWAEIIKETIKKTEKFQTSPFSTLLLNAYLSANFDDFWPGDVELKANGYPRWQAIFSRAVCSLVKDGFILNIPGKKYHYQWDAFNG